MLGVANTFVKEKPLKLYKNAFREEVPLVITHNKNDRKT